MGDERTESRLLGALPNGWTAERLEELAQITKGRVLPTSSDSLRSAVRYLGASDIEGQDAGPFVSGENAVVCNPDDVLMLWDGERSGLVGCGLSGAASSTVARMRPFGEKVASRYLYHHLRQRFAEIQSLRTGTGVPHVPRDLQTFVRVPVPPLEEQRRIAEVLDSVDAAISSSERVLAKLACVKRGSADHLLKSLPLNSSLATGLERIDAGWSPSCVDRPPLEQEWGVLKVSSITTETFDPSESKTLPATLRHRAELVANVGDVLTARANGVADLVARTAIVDDLDHKNLMISDKTLRLVPRPMLSARYLTLCMQHEMIRSQVRGLVTGSTGQGNISQEELLSLRIAIPEFQCQLEIERALTAIDARILAEKNHSKKLRRLRAGLAGDLLSGRVRTVAA